MAPRFRLSQAMGADYMADPADITSTKRALNRLGYYDDPDGDFGAWVDSGLFKGIRQFQKDKDLEVDGFMKPGGETEQAIDVALATTQDKPANENQKPANDDDWNEAFKDCYHQYELDSMRCRMLPTAKLRGKCWEDAAERMAQCKRGRKT